MNLRNFQTLILSVGTGNFEGMIHLIRRNDPPVDEIEDKLLAIRKERKQPSRMKKFFAE